MTGRDGRACWPAPSAGSRPAAPTAAPSWRYAMASSCTVPASRPGPDPCVCASCGKLKMKTLRVGVSRLREELAAVLGVAVAELSGPAARSGPGRARSAAVDTGGAWHQGGALPLAPGQRRGLPRLRPAPAVAPARSATDESLALLVRAGRLVGPRGGGNTTRPRVLLQTRVPEHPVLLAAMRRAQPEAVLADQVELRRGSGLPPFSAMALVSGTQAATYVAALEAGRARERGDGDRAGGRPVIFAACPGPRRAVRTAGVGTPAGGTPPAGRSRPRLGVTPAPERAIGPHRYTGAVPSLTIRQYGDPVLKSAPATWTRSTARCCRSPTR